MAGHTARMGEIRKAYETGGNPLKKQSIR